MNKILLIIFFAVSMALGQYPKAIVGDGVKPYVFPANSDTFWILRDSQYKNALKKKDSLDIARQELSLFNKKFELQKEIAKLQLSITDTVKFGYNHYKNLWKETDRKLEDAEIKASQRWTYFNVGFWVGILTSVTAVVVLNNLN